MHRRDETGKRRIRLEARVGIAQPGLGASRLDSIAHERLDDGDGPAQIARLKRRLGLD